MRRWGELREKKKLKEERNADRHRKRAVIEAYGETRNGRISKSLRRVGRPHFRRLNILLS